MNHVCPECGATFEDYVPDNDHEMDWPRNWRLAKHINSTHKVGALWHYVCWCGKAFGSHSSTGRHLEQFPDLREHMLMGRIANL